MTPAEIEVLVRHLVQRHGLTKVRLTGGEPTSRSDLLEIVTRLAKVEGLTELAMTTNGLTLAGHARTLAQAGLHRVNISLDSLDPERFSRMTGIDALPRVLAGIAAARSAGLLPVKLNAVVVRGENLEELPQLVTFAAQENLEIRFIELMPMGPLAGSWAKRYVAEAEMRDVLAPLVAQWESLGAGRSPAHRYRLVLADGRSVNVGFITAMSCHFCNACNRMRIAADGTFYPCLMDRPAGTLLPALRPTWDPQRFDALLREGLQQKAATHPAVGVGVMTSIGG